VAASASADQSQPLVSVLTPFHDTADHLAECIESVLAQTYTNFEYILLDNQSTDGSSEIAARFAEKDPRIRILSTSQLLPQTENYNCALRQISPGSKYCKIVQADDWLYPACVEEMVAVAELYPSIGLVSSYRLVGTEVAGTGLPPRQAFFDGKTISRMHLLGAPVFLFGSETTVMYRSEIVRSRDPFYREDALHSDTEAAHEILLSWDFGFVSQVLSYTRLDDGSIAGRSRQFRPRDLDFFLIVSRIGPRVLSDSELRRVYASARDNYYRAIASRWMQNLLRSQNRDFWAYHRAGLETVGEPFRLGRFLRAVAYMAVQALVSPRDLWRVGRNASKRPAQP
jgi:glycosyltransferase involved in cell wall biosynthesis